MFVKKKPWQASLKVPLKTYAPVLRGWFCESPNHQVVSGGENSNQGIIVKLLFRVMMMKMAVVKMMMVMILMAMMVNYNYLLPRSPVLFQSYDDDGGRGDNEGGGNDGYASYHI